MKRSALFSIILALTFVLAACAPAAKPTAAPTAASTPESTAEPTAEPTAAAVVLELAGFDGATRALTLAELQALPAYEGWGGWVTSAGTVNLPVRYRGVLLKDLCDLIGGLQPGAGLRIVASDGYAMTISYDQVAAGDFIAYDPGTKAETTVTDPLKAVVIYERDGQPLDADKDGTLRLALLNSEQLQITDGHWWVKWIARVEMKSLAEDWTLHMEGARIEDMDRNTFESCSAPNCHGATWTDDQAQEWAGTPLWLLAGRIDDEIQHNNGAFNTALADSGYTISVIAADGYSATLDIAQVLRGNDFILAYSVNDNPLDEEYFPLRLVGPALQGNQMVGQIKSITLQFGAGAAEAEMETETEPTAEPAAEAAPAGELPACPGGLALGGAVETPSCLTLMDLQGLELAQISAEHPKNGVQQYTGLRLNDLLALVGASPDAGTLKLTASDGYAIELPLGEVRNCADCMLAVDLAGGGLTAVMPGMESSVWVKNVVEFLVQ
jgi:hypothetical protein